MRFLIIILFYISFLSSQEFKGDDFLILEGESLQYYYVLTKAGYYLSDNPDKLNYYSKPVPKSLNVGLNTLTGITHNSKSYLLYPGGGLLYSFANGSIERIDRSFPHRNQYGGFFFSYKNNIYLIGGYGFWETKNIITKYNFNNGDWEKINTIGQSPKGIDQGTYFIKNDVLYVFDFLSRNTNNQIESRNNNIYTLNLKSFKWKKLGVISALIPEFGKMKGSKRFFKIGDKLIISYSENPEFFIVDFETNSLQKFKNDMLFYKSRSPIVKENKIIGGIKNPITGDISIESFEIKISESNKIGEGSYLYGGTKEFFKNVYLSFSFLIGLVIILAAYYKKVSNLYFIDKKSISNSGNSVSILENEYEILKLFINEKSVSNSSIMEIFHEQNKTKDYAVKKKNKTLLSLEKKLSLIFKKSFIKKEKSKSDSRQLNYFLNKRIKIVDESNF